MDNKIYTQLENINSDLQNACSAALVLTESLNLNSYDAKAYAGAMSLLSDAIFQVKKNINELIGSAKH